MRMSQEDARTRRDHARRNGSATEYDALLGQSSYDRKPGAALPALAQHVRGSKTSGHAAAANKPGVPHTW